MADVLDVTFFTDEAWFHLLGYVNSQNSRLWSFYNSHSLHETPLHDKKVGVWVVISRCRIVGPIFFYEHNKQRALLFGYSSCLHRSYDK